MKITDVSIDHELKSFLPPLSTAERAELKSQIERDGFTDPIIVWLNHGTIIDGHNRYQIWQELGSDPDNAPDIVEKKFADKAAVMEWMFKRQDGRRNWTAAQKSIVALKMKPAIEERAKTSKVESGKATGRGNKKVSTNSSKPLAVDTRKEIAAIAGVSEDTVRKTESVMEEGTPEIKAALAAGEISANKAFKETKRPKNGSVVKPAYDEKKLEKPLGVIRRELDERLKAFPTTERLYRATKHALSQFCDRLNDWRSGK